MSNSYTEAQNKFRIESLSSWSDGIKSIFPVGYPEYCEWKTLAEIISVLKKVGSTSNHTFFPTGGGLDLKGAESSEYEEGIELDFGGEVPHIIIPNKLIFVGDINNSEWSFFYLQTNELEPTDIYVNEDNSIDEIKTVWRREELVRLVDGTLMNRSHWDNGTMNDEYGEEIDLPVDAKLITRVFNGNFVIFAKGSSYNLVPSAYDAFQDKKSFDDFVKFIDKMKS